MKPSLPAKGIRQSALVVLYCLLSILSFAKAGSKDLSHINSANAPFNTAPVAGDDYFHMISNTTITGSYVWNDADPDGDSLSIAGITINAAEPRSLIETLITVQGGTIDMYSDGNFTYTPPLNFWGNDQVVYTICDVNAQPLCTTATIYILLIPGTTLPVILSAFTGKRSGKDNFLQWTTSQENNADHFELQHCTDNTSFTKIASITAKGNSSVPTNYSYVHYNHPTAPVNYYRLILVDKDGRSVYSKVVAIKADGTGVILQTVYPNPFRDKLQLAISTEHAGMLRICLYDMSGKLALLREEKSVKGLNIISINGLNTLQTGSYIIDISGTINILKAKLVKGQ